MIRQRSEDLKHLILGKRATQKSGLACINGWMGVKPVLREWYGNSKVYERAKVKNAHMQNKFSVSFQCNYLSTAFCENV